MIARPSFGGLDSMVQTEFADRLVADPDAQKFKQIIGCFRKRKIDANPTEQSLEASAETIGEAQERIGAAFAQTASEANQIEPNQNNGAEAGFQREGARPFGLTGLAAGAEAGGTIFFWESSIRCWRTLCKVSARNLRP